MIVSLECMARRGYCARAPEVVAVEVGSRRERAVDAANNGRLSEGRRGRDESNGRVLLKADWNSLAVEGIRVLYR